VEEVTANARDWAVKFLGGMGDVVAVGSAYVECSNSLNLVGRSRRGLNRRARIRSLDLEVSGEVSARDTALCRSIPALPRFVAYYAGTRYR
jgi:hypothetical protein